jgi:hypothetical protein
MVDGAARAGVAMREKSAAMLYETFMGILDIQ